jgi:hypothetical protein
MGQLLAMDADLRGCVVRVHRSLLVHAVVMVAVALLASGGWQV